MAGRTGRQRKRTDSGLRAGLCLRSGDRTISTPGGGLEKNQVPVQPTQSMHRCEIAGHSSAISHDFSKLLVAACVSGALSTFAF
jgi:hypothetical protein